MSFDPKQDANSRQIREATDPYHKHLYDVNGYCDGCGHLVSGTRLDRPDSQPEAPEKGHTQGDVDEAQKILADRRDALRKQKGKSLTPLEGLEAGFLTLCEQYQAFGKQLQFIAASITELKAEYVSALLGVNKRPILPPPPGDASSIQWKRK